VRAACVELAWSLWTELGVPGVVRRHDDCAIDPEPLLVWTPAVVAEEPRLGELVHAWVAQHGEWLSWTRVQGLRRRFPESSWRAFEDAALPLGPRAKGPPGGGEPDASRRDRIPSSLPMDRPSLLRLRARALCGVGARADVLCELLGRPPVWTSAADLAGLGYSKRSAARVLADFGTAGIAEIQARDNVHRFRLRSVPSLETILGRAVTRIAWDKLLPFLSDLLDSLERIADRPDAVQRVEGHKLRERVAPVAVDLGLKEPPATRGERDALGRVARWGVERAHEIARIPGEG